MRAIATSPAARGLMDDAAVIELGTEALVLTHDMMAEGVHWLPDADPADVAWKLVAVNLSDLAAKGAVPIGILLGFTLGDADWDRKFAVGLQQAIAFYDVPLLGGDTIGMDSLEACRVIGLTALGRASHHPVPARSGAKAGDGLFVTGNIGDAAAGFTISRDGVDGAHKLRDAFNRPNAQIAAGAALAPTVNAMMDISDGLLLDALRMAQASHLAVEIDLSQIPLSAEFIALHGGDREARMIAASWGDDYQLLFATSAQESPVPATRVGRFFAGSGLTLCDGVDVVPLPASLGYEHR